MKQGLLWSPCHHSLSIPSRPSLPLPIRRTKPISRPISATLETTADTQQLTARERRQLKNERRESKTTNWREEVEEKLLVKTKPRFAHWKEKLDLDTLADLGPQWWILRISKPTDTTEVLAKALVRNFPSIEFKVYNPSVHVKRKLKNGTISVKPKPLYSGCAFIRCVLNKELHDFIRKCPGVWGFVGFKVGNTRRQISRPKPVPIEEMEAVFQSAKEEQEKADKAFEEEQQANGTINLDNVRVVPHSDTDDVTISVVDSKPKRRSRKKSDPLASEKGEKLPVRGSTVRIVSGTFAEFSGTVKTLSRKTGKATVGVTVFGKESLVDLHINDIVAETK